MNPTNHIRELAEAVYRAMNSRDFTDLEQCLTDEAAFDFPGTGRTEGRRRTLLLLKTLLRKYPKLHFTVSEVIIQGERACAVWINEGEDSRGEPYKNSGVTLFHFTGGKISFISDYFKDTSFTRQAF